MNFTKLATLILAACDWLNVHAGAHCLHVCISCAENFVLDVSGLQTIAFGCFLMFPLSVCIPTHTHPSGIPYDGGHQDTPSLTSHIHHREVCRLPPPRLKSNSKTSPKDLPKWMPMHNLLIKTVTNNLLHHTIQIWCPMSIIKSELAQENTKFWKAVSLEVILYCLVLIPRLQYNRHRRLWRRMTRTCINGSTKHIQTQNGSGAPPSVCSNMIWQAHPCPGKLGGHLGRKCQWRAEDLSNTAELENFAWHRKHVNLLYPFYPSSFAVCKLLESARGSLWLSDRLFAGH